MDIQEIVAGTMNVYRTAFEEGRKVGFTEGYRKANEEILEIINRKKKEEGTNEPK
ncbi:MAG: hypothetical protein ABIF10_05530 [Candidatus Woesearchaeota archaeon]